MRSAYRGRAPLADLGDSRLEPLQDGACRRTPPSRYNGGTKQGKECFSRLHRVPDAGPSDRTAAASRTGDVITEYSADSGKDPVALKGIIGTITSWSRRITG